MHTVSIILQYAKTKINTIFISSKAKTEETKSSKSQLCFARFACLSNQIAARALLAYLIK